MTRHGSSKLFKLGRSRKAIELDVVNASTTMGGQPKRRPLRVNFVISKDLKSKIFHDIFKRFINYDSTILEVEISEAPQPGADVYHYHRPHLEKSLAAPAVVTVHHDPRDVDPWLDPEKFWSVYRQTDRIVCLNSLQVKDLQKVQLTNTSIVPHGFDAKIFSKQQKFFDPEKKLNFGIISKRYDRRFKGEAYIYELVDRLDPARVRFTLVGAGRSVDAEHLRQLGFEVNVHEFLPYRMFGSLYRELDFLLMVSTYEGGPANLPEALASSVPILCTNCGMVPDLVRDGKNGAILSGDIRTDISIFDRILKNEQNFTNDLFKGAHEIKTVISWEEVIRRHVEIYWEIVDERARTVG